jgi:hypothetical protein
MRPVLFVTIGQDIYMILQLHGQLLFKSSYQLVHGYINNT